MLKANEDISFEELQSLAEGKLSEPRKTEVEQALQNDVLLKETYNGIVAFLETESESIGDFVHRVDRNIEQLAQNETSTVSIQKKNRNVLKKWYGLGAAAAIIAAGFYVFKPSTLQPSEFDFTDAGLSVTLSINHQKLNEAMNAYKLADFPAAQDLLVQELATNPDNDTLNYYLGVIAKEQKQFEVAKGYFEGVDPQSYFYEKAQYQMGLTYWYLGDFIKAKEAFELIDNQPNHIFHAKAQEILAKWK